jgi:anti-sigma factor RsiW
MVVTTGYLENILLFSYVDGELNVDNCCIVEEFLASDAAAREKVAQAIELNILLRAAFADGGDQAEIA